MTTAEFLDRAIEMGLAEVRSCPAYADHNEYKRDGAVEGFEACRRLRTLEQFEAKIADLEAEQVRLREAMLDAPPKGIDHGLAYRTYWRHRMKMAQVEHVYGLLCVASRVNRWHGHDRLPDRLALSARLTLQYARIMGVKGQNA
jgi:hypothetical protein